MIALGRERGEGLTPGSIEIGAGVILRSRRMHACCLACQLLAAAGSAASAQRFAGLVDWGRSHLICLRTRGGGAGDKKESAERLLQRSLWRFPSAIAVRGKQHGKPHHAPNSQLLVSTVLVVVRWPFAR